MMRVYLVNNRELQQMGIGMPCCASMKEASNKEKEGE
jgi:hypothetical protein